MSLRKESARLWGGELIVSCAPDVCLKTVGTAVVPVPFSLTAKLSDSAATCSHVNMTGNPTFTLESHIICCKGDAPGDKKGIKSGTTESICEPIGHSGTVRAEGANVVRDGDCFHMNNCNTCGILQCKKDMGSYEVAQANIATGQEVYTDAVKSGTGAKPKVPTLPKGVSKGAKTLSPLLDIFDGLSDGNVTDTRIATLLSNSDLESFIHHPTAALTSPEAIDILQSAAEDAINADTYAEAEAIVTEAIATALDEERNYIAEQAGEKAEEKEGTVEGSSTVGVTGKTGEIPCFDVPPNMDRGKFERQLKEQQDEINNLSPEEFQQRRSDFLSGKTKRNPGAQRKARLKYRTDETERLTRKNIANGMGEIAAEQSVVATVIEAMKSLDATHTLDMIAGGLPDVISGLGNFRINRSIGSQWKSRVKHLDAHAEQAIKDGKDKMDVELNPC